MKSEFFFICAVLFAISVCNGATVQWCDAVLGPHGSTANYMFGLHSTDGFIFGMEITILISPDKSEAVMQNTLKNYLAADAALLVQVDFGTPINNELFKGSSGSFFNAYTSTKHITETDLTIKLNETIILAFAIGAVSPYDGIFYTGIYGWLELCYDDSGVRIVDDVVPMTTDSGIFAGTYTIIPEPSTSGLALAGLGLLFRRRRESRNLTYCNKQRNIT